MDQVWVTNVEALDQLDKQETLVMDKASCQIELVHFRLTQPGSVVLLDGASTQGSVRGYEVG